MTNKEKIKNIIDKDFNKKNNYNEIINKMNNKPNYYYLLVPVCIVLVVFIFYKNSKPEMLKGTFKTTTNDNIIININDINVISNYNLNNTSKSSNNYIDNYYSIPYFEVLNDLTIPKDFDNKDYFRVKFKDNKINNYEYWCFNTKNNRRIIIGVSDKNIPIGNIDISIEQPNISRINFTKLEIYRYNNSFVAKFNYNGYNFNVESNDITEKEFIDLLKSIIKE
ncbi:MAG: hypothetical protein II119_01830 [Bacilli bacterium]|nr:hypothetical protein [Bacilli bacterium]